MADVDPRWASSVRSSSAAVSVTGARFLHMTVQKLVETTPGKFSLLLHAGTTPVDALVEELGHEPNGYFWEGVSRRLVATEAPSLESRFRYDPEGERSPIDLAVGWRPRPCPARKPAPGEHARHHPVQR